MTKWVAGSFSGTKRSTLPDCKLPWRIRGPLTAGSVFLVRCESKLPEVPVRTRQRAALTDGIAASVVGFPGEALNWEPTGEIPC